MTNDNNVEFKINTSQKGYDQIVKFLGSGDSYNLFEILEIKEVSGNPPTYKGVTIKYSPQRELKENLKTLEERQKAFTELSKILADFATADLVLGTRKDK